MSPRPLASELGPADTETALATLAEIWTEYRSLDRNDILSARQRQVLDRLGSLVYGDEEES